MRRFSPLWTLLVPGFVLSVPDPAAADPEASPEPQALARVGVTVDDMGRSWSPGALPTPAAIAADPWSAGRRVHDLTDGLRPDDLPGTVERAWAELGIEPAPVEANPPRSPLEGRVQGRPARLAARKMDPTVAATVAAFLDLAAHAAAFRQAARPDEALSDDQLAELAGISRQTATYVEAALSDLAGPGIVWPEQAMVLPTAHGRIWIGSRGTDVFDAPFVAVLDPGGDDLYLGEAAAPPLSVVVDLAGADGYRDLPVAARGVAIVVDRMGDDDYRDGSFGQGAASEGCGMLLDLQGDDRYRAGAWSQGAALSGVGLLLDAAGHDVRDVVAPGQGVGQGRGFGALVDRSGDDTYRAAEGLTADLPAQGAGVGQGPGSPGGIGLLADLAGDDTYQASQHAQGFGRWHGLGAVLDRGGHDRWLADGRAQGCALGEAVGVLLDVEGDDRYATGDHGQGFAHDRAVGLLFDSAGDDEYTGGLDAQGVATAGSVAVISDRAGDDRWYRASAPTGAGTERGEESIALRLDVTGRDTWSEDSSGDGHARVHARHALELDLPTPPPRSLGQAAGADPDLVDADPGSLLALAGSTPGEQADAAVARLADHGPGLYTTLQATLDASDPATVRATSRVLHAMAARDPAWAGELQSLLAADLASGIDPPEAAHVLVWWATVGPTPTDPTLPLAYLERPDPPTRRAAAALLQPMCTGDEIADRLHTTLLQDDDVLVRAAAARALAGCGARADLATLAALLADAPLPVTDAISATLVQLALSGHRTGVLEAVRPSIRDGHLPALAVAARIPDPSNLTALKALLAHDAPATRGHAALALGAIGSTTAIKALMGREAIEADPFVRWCLDRALRTPGNPPAIAPPIH